jgi:hypothetical protein
MPDPDFFAEVTQQIHSLRARGVSFYHLKKERPRIAAQPFF